MSNGFNISDFQKKISVTDEEKMQKDLWDFL